MAFFLYTKGSVGPSYAYRGRVQNSQSFGKTEVLMSMYICIACRCVVWRDMRLAPCRWRFGAVRGGGRRLRDDVPSVLSCPIVSLYVRATLVHEVIAIYRGALTLCQLPFVHEVVAFYLDKMDTMRNGSVSGSDVVLHASESHRGSVGAHVVFMTCQNVCVA